MMHTLFWILPEVWLSTIIFLLLALDLKWGEEKHPLMGLIAIAGMLPLFPILFLLAKEGGSHELFSGMFRVDTMALFFKGIFTVSGIVALVLAREFGKAVDRAHGEFYLLFLIAVLGMFLAASSANFLMLFISLELVAITLYVLVSYLHTNLQSLESGLKYLVLGSLSSALFLYGIAFIYGTTGSLHFETIHAMSLRAQTLPAGLVFGILLVLAGILFKAAVVPFQIWAPDVYQGAPTPVTAFLSVGSKALAFLVALRILQELFLPFSMAWNSVLVFASGATILYGNLCAIPQTNIKRFMAYSSIGHAGYLLMGITAGVDIGSAAVSYYLLGYLFTNLVLFLVITAVTLQTGSDEIKSFAGLSKRSPFLAAAMFIGLLSLAGVPPMAGFFGKFLLVLSALSQGYLTLAIIGAVAVVISLYYYLRVVQTLYADEPVDATPIKIGTTMKMSIVACLIGIFVLGIWQYPFLAISIRSIQHIF